MEDFYETVKARDVAMFNNSISEIEKRDAKVATLIHGGFHTKGITKLLRENNYSYIVVSPYSSTDIDEENYHFLLSGKRKPISDLIKELNGSLRTLGTFVSDEIVNEYNSDIRLQIAEITGQDPKDLEMVPGRYRFWEFLLPVFFGEALRNNKMRREVGAVFGQWKALQAFSRDMQFQVKLSQDNRAFRFRYKDPRTGETRYFQARLDDQDKVVYETIAPRFFAGRMIGIAGKKVVSEHHGLPKRAVDTIDRPDFISQLPEILLSLIHKGIYTVADGSADTYIFTELSAIVMEKTGKISIASERNPTIIPNVTEAMPLKVELNINTGEFRVIDDDGYNIFLGLEGVLEAKEMSYVKTTVTYLPEVLLLLIRRGTYEAVNSSGLTDIYLFTELSVIVDEETGEIIRVIDNSDSTTDINEAKAIPLTVELNGSTWEFRVSYDEDSYVLRGLIGKIAEEDMNQFRTLIKEQNILKQLLKALSFLASKGRYKVDDRPSGRIFIFNDPAVIIDEEAREVIGFSEDVEVELIGPTEALPLTVEINAHTLEIEVAVSDHQDVLKDLGQEGLLNSRQIYEIITAVVEFEDRIKEEGVSIARSGAMKWPGIDSDGDNYASFKATAHTSPLPAGHILKPHEGPREVIDENKVSRKNVDEIIAYCDREHDVIKVHGYEVRLAKNIEETSSTKEEIQKMLEEEYTDEEIKKLSTNEEREPDPLRIVAADKLPGAALGGDCIGNKLVLLSKGLSKIKDAAARRIMTQATLRHEIRWHELTGKDDKAHDELRTDEKDVTYIVKRAAAQNATLIEELRPALGGTDLFRMLGEKLKTVMSVALTDSEFSDQLRRNRLYPSAAILGPLELQSTDAYLDLAGGPGTYTLAALIKGVKKAIWLDISSRNLSLASELFRNIHNLTDEDVRIILNNPSVDIMFLLDDIKSRVVSEGDIPENVDMIKGDARGMDLESDSIDKLSVTDLLVWLGDKEKQDLALKEMLRVTKAGGLIHITQATMETEELRGSFIYVAGELGIKLEFQNTQPYKNTEGLLVKIVSKDNFLLADAETVPRLSLKENVRRIGNSLRYSFLQPSPSKISRTIFPLSLAVIIAGLTSSLIGISCHVISFIMEILALVVPSFAFLSQPAVGLDAVASTLENAGFSAMVPISIYVLIIGSLTLYNRVSVGEFLFAYPTKSLGSLTFPGSVVISDGTPIAELHLSNRMNLQRALPGESSRYRDIRFGRAALNDLLELTRRVRDDEQFFNGVGYFKMQSHLFDRMIADKTSHDALSAAGFLFETPTGSSWDNFLDRLLMWISLVYSTGTLLPRKEIGHVTTAWISREDLPKAIAILEERIQRLDFALDRAIENKRNPLPKVLELIKNPSFLRRMISLGRARPIVSALWFTHAMIEVTTPEGEEIFKGIFTGSADRLTRDFKAPAGTLLEFAEENKTYLWNGKRWRLAETVSRLSEVTATERPDKGRGYSGLDNTIYSSTIQEAIESGKFAAVSYSTEGGVATTDLALDDDTQQPGQVTLTQARLENLNRVIRGLSDEEQEFLARNGTILFMEGYDEAIRKIAKGAGIFSPQNCYGSHYGVKRHQYYLDVRRLDNPEELRRHLHHEIAERKYVIKGLIQIDLIEDETRIHAIEGRGPELQTAINTLASAVHMNLIQAEELAAKVGQLPKVASNPFYEIIRHLNERFGVNIEMNNLPYVRGELIEYEAGADIMRKGEMSDALYIIYEGEVKVPIARRSGLGITFIRRERNIVGEMGMFSLDQTRSATVKAGTEGAKLLRVSYREILPVIRNNPQLFFILNLYALETRIYQTNLERYARTVAKDRGRSLENIKAYIKEKGWDDEAEEVLFLDSRGQGLAQATMREIQEEEPISELSITLEDLRDGLPQYIKDTYGYTGENNWGVDLAITPEIIGEVWGIANSRPRFLSMIAGLSIDKQLFMFYKLCVIYLTARAPFAKEGQTSKARLRSYILQYEAEDAFARTINYKSEDNILNISSLSPDFAHLYGISSAYSELVEYNGVISSLYRAILQGELYYEMAVDLNFWNPGAYLPEEMNQAMMDAVRVLSEESDIHLSIHGPIFYAMPGIEYDSEIIKKTYKDTIDLAKKIGAKSIVIHVTSEEEIDDLVEIAIYGAEQGVELSLENSRALDGGSYQDAERFLTVVEGVARQVLERRGTTEFLNLTLDASHFALSEQSEIEAVERVLDWALEASPGTSRIPIKKIHLSQHAGDMDSHGLRLVDESTGRGVVSNRELMRLLARRLPAQSLADLEIILETAVVLTDEDRDWLRDNVNMLIREHAAEKLHHASWAHVHGLYGGEYYDKSNLAMADGMIIDRPLVRLLHEEGERLARGQKAELGGKYVFEAVEIKGLKALVSQDIIDGTDGEILAILSKSLAELDFKSLRGDTPFILTSLSKSLRLFEDHAKNYFAGINQAFLRFYKQYKSDPSRKVYLDILLQVALEHELRHETGKADDAIDAARIMELCTEKGMGVDGFISFFMDEKVIDEEFMGLIRQAKRTREMLESRVKENVERLRLKWKEDPDYFLTVPSDRLDQGGVETILEYIRQNPGCYLSFGDMRKISAVNYGLTRGVVDKLIPIMVNAAHFIAEEEGGLNARVGGDEQKLVLPPDLTPDEVNNFRLELQLTMASFLAGYGFVKVNGITDENIEEANERLETDRLAGVYKDKDGFFMVFEKEKYPEIADVLKELNASTEGDVIDVPSIRSDFGAVKIRPKPDFKEEDIMHAVYGYHIQEAEYIANISLEHGMHGATKGATEALSDWPDFSYKEEQASIPMLSIKDRRDIASRYNEKGLNIYYNMIEEYYPVVKREYLIMCLSQLFSAEPGASFLVRGPPDNFYIAKKNENGTVTFTKLQLAYEPKGEIRTEVGRALARGEVTHDGLRPLWSDIDAFGFKILNEFVGHEEANKALLVTSKFLYEYILNGNDLSNLTPGKLDKVAGEIEDRINSQGIEVGVKCVIGVMETESAEQFMNREYAEAIDYLVKMSEPSFADDGTLKNVITVYDEETYAEKIAEFRRLEREKFRAILEEFYGAKPLSIEDIITYRVPSDREKIATLDANKIMSRKIKPEGFGGFAKVSDILDARSIDFVAREFIEYFDMLLGAHDRPRICILCHDDADGISSARNTEAFIRQYAELMGKEVDIILRSEGNVNARDLEEKYEQIKQLRTDEDYHSVIAVDLYWGRLAGLIPGRIDISIDHHPFNDEEQALEKDLMARFGNSLSLVNLNTLRYKYTSKSMPACALSHILLDYTLRKKGNDSGLMTPDGWGITLDDYLDAGISGDWSGEFWNTNDTEISNIILTLAGTGKNGLKIVEEEKDIERLRKFYTLIIEKVNTVVDRMFAENQREDSIAFIYLSEEDNLINVEDAIFSLKNIIIEFASRREEERGISERRVLIFATKDKKKDIIKYSLRFDGDKTNFILSSADTEGQIGFIDELLSRYPDRFGGGGHPGAIAVREDISDIIEDDAAIIARANEFADIAKEILRDIDSTTRTAHFQAIVAEDLAYPDDPDLMAMVDVLKDKPVMFDITNGQIEIRAGPQREALFEILGLRTAEAQKRFIEKLTRLIRIRLASRGIIFDENTALENLSFIFGDEDNPTDDFDFTSPYGNCIKDGKFFINIKALVALREETGRQSSFLLGISHEMVHEITGKEEEIEEELTEEDAEFMLDGQLIGAEPEFEQNFRDTLDPESILLKRLDSIREDTQDFVQAPVSPADSSAFFVGDSGKRLLATRSALQSIFNQQAFPTEIARIILSNSGVVAESKRGEDDILEIDLSWTGVNDNISIVFIPRDEFNHRNPLLIEGDYRTDGQYKPYMKNQEGEAIEYVLPEDITINELVYLIEDIDSVINDKPNRLKLSSLFSQRFKHMAIYLAREIPWNSLSGEERTRIQSLIEVLYLIGDMFDETPSYTITEFEDIRTRLLELPEGQAWQDFKGYLEEELDLTPDRLGDIQDVAGWIETSLEPIEREIHLKQMAELDFEIFAKGVEELYEGLETDDPLPQLLRDRLPIEDWRARLEGATPEKEIEVIEELATVIREYDGWQGEELDWSLRFILERKELNCVSRSILIARICKEIGIGEGRLFAGSFPEHAFLLFELSDGNYVYIEVDSEIEINIIKLDIPKNYVRNGLKARSDINIKLSRELYPGLPNSQLLNVSTLAEGFKASVYYNLGVAIKKRAELTKDQARKLGLLDMACSFYKRAIELTKNRATNYVNLGVAISLRRDLTGDMDERVKLSEETISLFEKALAIYDCDRYRELLRAAKNLHEYYKTIRDNFRFPDSLEDTARSEEADSFQDRPVTGSWFPDSPIYTHVFSPFVEFIVPNLPSFFIWEKILEDPLSFNIDFGDMFILWTLANVIHWIGHIYKNRDNMTSENIIRLSLSTGSVWVLIVANFDYFHPVTLFMIGSTMLFHYVFVNKTPEIIWDHFDKNYKNYHVFLQRFVLWTAEKVGGIDESKKLLYRIAAIRKDLNRSAVSVAPEETKKKTKKKKKSPTQPTSVKPVKSIQELIDNAEGLKLNGNTVSFLVVCQRISRHRTVTWSALSMILKEPIPEIRSLYAELIRRYKVPDLKIYDKAKPTKTKSADKKLREPLPVSLHKPPKPKPVPEPQSSPKTPIMTAGKENGLGQVSSLTLGRQREFCENIERIFRKVGLKEKQAELAAMALVHLKSGSLLLLEQEGLLSEEELKSIQDLEFDESLFQGLGRKIRHEVELYGNNGLPDIIIQHILRTHLFPWKTLERFQEEQGFEWDNEGFAMIADALNHIDPAERIRHIIEIKENRGRFNPEKHLRLHSPDAQILDKAGRESLIKELENRKRVLELMVEQPLGNVVTYSGVEDLGGERYVVYIHNGDWRELYVNDILIAARENLRFRIEEISNRKRIKLIALGNSQGYGLPREGVLQTESNDSAFKEFQVLEALLTNLRKNSNFSVGHDAINSFLNLAQLSADESRQELEKEAFFNSAIPYDETVPKGDMAQEAWVNISLDSPQLTVAEAPAGTGKTTVCEELSRQFLFRSIREKVGNGARILYLSHQHQAVDKGITDMIGELPVLRLGNDRSRFNYGTHRVWPGNREEGVRQGVVDEFNQKREQTNGGYIVAATNIGIATDWYFREHLFKEMGGFDIIIMDEASCTTLTEALVPFVLLKQDGKIILVGDITQLPPFGLKDEEKRYLKEHGVSEQQMEIYNRSVLEWALEKAHGDRVRLLTNYRSPAPIVELESLLFYEGELHPAQWWDDPDAIQIIDIREGSGVKEYHDRGINTSFKNARSSKEDIEIVRDLVLRQGVDPKDIVIITPYAVQKEHVEKRLKHELPQGVYAPSMISTIDSYQGGENKIVIFDLVRSNDKNLIGFLKDKRRLNVGLSRAGGQLIIIWDSRTLLGKAPKGLKNDQKRQDKEARELFRAIAEYYKEWKAGFMPLRVLIGHDEAIAGIEKALASSATANFSLLSKSHSHRGEGRAEVFSITGEEYSVTEIDKINALHPYPLAVIKSKDTNITFTIRGPTRGGERTRLVQYIKDNLINAIIRSKSLHDGKLDQNITIVLADRYDFLAGDHRDNNIIILNASDLEDMIRKGEDSDLIAELIISILSEELAHERGAEGDKTTEERLAQACAKNTRDLFNKERLGEYVDFIEEYGVDSEDHKGYSGYLKLTQEIKRTRQDQKYLILELAMDEHRIAEAKVLLIDFGKTLASSQGPSLFSLDDNVMQNLILIEQLISGTDLSIHIISGSRHSKKIIEDILDLYPETLKILGQEFKKENGRFQVHEDVADKGQKAREILESINEIRRSLGMQDLTQESIVAIGDNEDIDGPMALGGYFIKVDALSVTTDVLDNIINAKRKATAN